jgi:hypothetical protein
VCWIGPHTRQRRADSDREAEATLAHERLQFARDIQHERAEHERLRVNLETAGSNLGDVEDLVDQVRK